jgi:hypothetical protein
MRRPIIIIVVCFAAAVVGFYFLAEDIRSRLGDQPYIGAVKTDLRALAAAQAKYRTTNGSYATDMAQLPVSRDSTPGAHVRIVAASADSFVAEGRHDAWKGRCVIAVRTYTSDSLTATEPRCYSP